MRKAILWIGLVVSAWMFWQSLSDYLLAEQITGVIGRDAVRGDIAGAASVCVVASIVMAIAALAAVRSPGSAAVMYILMTALLFRLGATSVYIYSPVWGISALVLAVMSLIAWRRSRVTPRS